MPLTARAGPDHSKESVIQLGLLGYGSKHLGQYILFHMLIGKQMDQKQKCI